MKDREKNIIAKLTIIKELATQKETQQLADVMIEYIKAGAKGELGFVVEKEEINV